MIRKQICWTLLCLILVSLAHCQVRAQENRVWKSANGKFSIEAKFEKVEDGIVYLRNSDGKQVKVPLARLSKADQSHASSMGDNPFEVNEGGEEPKPESSTQPGNSKWPPKKDDEVEIKWGSSWYPGVVREVKGPNAYLVHYDKYGDSDFHDTTVPLDRLRDPSVDSTLGKYPAPRKKVSDADSIKLASSWNLPTGIPTPKDEIGNARIQMGSPSAYFNNPLILSMDQKMLFISKSPGGREKMTEMLAIDVKKEKVLGSTKLPISKNYFRDVSSNGKVILSSSGTFFPDENRFDLWKIGDKGELIHLKGGRIDTPISQARFVFDDRIALISKKGVVSIWDIKSAPKPLYKTHELRSYSTILDKVSADRKHLFLSTLDMLVAIDTQTGTSNGVLRYEKAGRISAFAVHPDHSKIATASRNRIKIFDEHGSKTHDFYVPSTSFKDIYWIDDRYLSTGLTIVDTKLNVEVSSVKFSGIRLTGIFKTDQGGNFWSYDPVLRQLLRRPRITSEMLSEKLTQEPEITSAFGTDKKVALKVTGSMPSDVRKSLEANLKEQGIMVASSANAQISMTQTSKTQTNDYRDFRRGGTTKLQTKSWTQKWVLSADGKEVMSASTTSGGSPGMLSANGDESLQQAANRYSKNPNFSFFKTLDLPETINKHPDGKPFFNLEL